jgi:hypothetical protein
MRPIGKLAADTKGSPMAASRDHGIESKHFDSVVNKMPLGYRVNRLIGGRTA